MKKISLIAIILMACVTISCSNKSNTAESDASAQTMTVDSLLSAAPALTDSLITVEGVCTHTCKHGATKMFLIGSDDTKTIRVEACELGAFKPEVVNSLVTVTGHLRETRIDEDYLTAWEEKLKENEVNGHGETGAGCDTERAARGVESTSASGQIEEYRQRIADKVNKGENPWISFYYIDAIEYEIN